MPLINCQINLLLTFSWPQDNAKMLKKIKYVFERTINWNKYQPKVSIERQNQYFNYLLDLSFQGVNRNFVL